MSETLDVATGDFISGRESGEGWWRETVLEVLYASEQTTLCATRYERSSPSCIENPGHSRWVMGDGREATWVLHLRPWRLLTKNDLEAIDAEAQP